MTHLKRAFSAALFLSINWSLSLFSVQAGPISGYAQMGEALRLMQDRDAENPAFLSIAQAKLIWQRDCQQCHAAPEHSMRGVAARFPKFSSALQMPLRLGEQINLCKSRLHQKPLPEEHAELLALSAFIGLQSRGMPLEPDQHAVSKQWRAQGAQWFEKRLGQLNLSCAQCHDERAGLKLGGTAIPEGHANGYPLYRLEWQALGSLQRRIKNCLTGVRAEHFAPDAQAWTAIELHLAQRALGLTVETPAVRP
jgi:L-cysteine S-thiosulfotransferase